jgi:hypothetical protein
LLLFLVPIIVFEPVKPVGLYLIAKGRVLTGAAFLTIGLLAKLLIVEQIFQMGRPKLMQIPLFAKAYDYAAAWLYWLKNLRLVRAVRRYFSDLKLMVRGYFKARKQLSAGTTKLKPPL